MKTPVLVSNIEVECIGAGFKVCGVVTYGDISFPVCTPVIAYEDVKAEGNRFWKRVKAWWGL